MITNLRDLLQRRRDEGDTWADMSRRTGGQISPSVLVKWAKGQYHEFPDVKTIRKIAQATDTDELTVVLGIAAMYGLTGGSTGGSIFGALLPRDIDDLSDADKLDIIHYVRRKLAAHHDSSHRTGRRTAEQH